MAKVNTMRAAAPRYVTSAATKKAYTALKNAYSNQNSMNKRIRTNIQRLYALGDFDPNKSAYYQSAYHALKDNYRRAGQADMENAAAIAAENSGGYGNSYAASAANQAYQAKMQALAAKVPEVYSAAESEFTNRKNNLANVIALQQQAQQAMIDKARFAVQTGQALDKARYEAAKYADSVNRNNAAWWWKRYYAST